jgi:hypothetical protein
VPRLRIFISFDLLHSSAGRFSGAKFFTSNLNSNYIVSNKSENLLSLKINSTGMKTLDSGTVEAQSNAFI